jgi:hypothetical protein
MAAAMTAQTKHGFGPGLNLPVLDERELTRAVEREDWRKRIVLIDGTGKPRRCPQHFRGHDRLER